MQDGGFLLIPFLFESESMFKKSWTPGSRRPNLYSPPATLHVFPIARRTHQDRSPPLLRPITCSASRHEPEALVSTLPLDWPSFLAFGRRLLSRNGRLRSDGQLGPGIPILTAGWISRPLYSPSLLLHSSALGAFN